MKHLILIASIVVPTSSIVAMEPIYYQDMLARISEAAKGHSSITIINDSKSSLSIEVGNLERDNIRSSINVYKNTQLTFSPYAHPFFLDKEHINNGTTLNLTLLEKKQPLPIGGNSNVQFGDTIRVKYDESNKKIIIVPDNKVVVKTLYNSYNNIDLGAFRAKSLSKPTKNLEKKLLSKRSNTIS